MKKNSIYALSALAVITIAGASFTMGRLSQNNKFIEKNDSLIDITDEYTGNKTDIEDETDTMENNKEDNLENIGESGKDTASTNDSKSQSSSNNNTKTGTYKVIENKDKGTYEVKFNDKVVVKDLKECIGETGKYLIFPKMGKDNIPDSEITDWDIAFINKQSGKVSIFEDALYLDDPYEMESRHYSIIDNTFYGIVETKNQRKLFKVDLTKDTITKNIIKNSPALKNIAGFYSKVDLLFVVDSKGDILSYNDKTNTFTKQNYTVKSSGEVLHFSEIYDTDDFIKDFKFVENYENKDGLELYVNRYEEHETGAFFEYNKEEGHFYLED